VNDPILINGTHAFGKRSQYADPLPHVLDVPQFYVIPSPTNLPLTYLIMCPNDMTWKYKIKGIIVIC